MRGKAVKIYGTFDRNLLPKLAMRPRPIHAFTPVSDVARWHTPSSTDWIGSRLISFSLNGALFIIEHMLRNADGFPVFGPPHLK